MRLWQDE